MYIFSDMTWCYTPVFKKTVSNMSYHGASLWNALHGTISSSPKYKSSISLEDRLRYLSFLSSPLSDHYKDNQEMASDNQTTTTQDSTEATQKTKISVKPLEAVLGSMKSTSILYPPMFRETKPLEQKASRMWRGEGPAPTDFGYVRPVEQAQGRAWRGGVPPSIEVLPSSSSADEPGHVEEIDSEGSVEGYGDGYIRNFKLSPMDDGPSCERKVWNYGRSDHTDVNLMLEKLSLEKQVQGFRDGDAIFNRKSFQETLDAHLAELEAKGSNGLDNDGDDGHIEDPVDEFIDGVSHHTLNEEHLKPHPLYHDSFLDRDRAIRERVRTLPFSSTADEPELTQSITDVVAEKCSHCHNTKFTKSCVYAGDELRKVALSCKKCCHTKVVPTYYPTPSDHSEEDLKPFPGLVSDWKERKHNTPIPCDFPKTKITTTTSPLVGETCYDCRGGQMHQRCDMVGDTLWKRTEYCEDCGKHTTQEFDVKPPGPETISETISESQDVRSGPPDIHIDPAATAGRMAEPWKPVTDPNLGVTYGYNDADGNSCGIMDPKLTNVMTDELHTSHSVEKSLMSPNGLTPILDAEQCRAFTYHLQDAARGRKYGIRDHPIQEINRVLPWLYKETPQEQLKYAHIIVKLLGHQPPFMECCAEAANFVIKEKFEDWNDLTIGNMAHMSLYAYDEDIKKQCVERLEAYKQYRRKQVVRGSRGNRQGRR